MTSLFCGDVTVGQQLQAIGNPTVLTFAHSWGHVSSKAENHSPHWERAFVATTPAGPGSSGGPVFDTEGRVVGLVVGGVTRGFPFVLVVPSSSVCFLMGTTI
jgi:S1-C subfamily serine protease